MWGGVVDGPYDGRRGGMTIKFEQAFSINKGDTLYSMFLSKMFFLKHHWIWHLPYFDVDQINREGVSKMQLGAKFHLSVYYYIHLILPPPLESTLAKACEMDEKLSYMYPNVRRRGGKCLRRLYGSATSYSIRFTENDDPWVVIFFY